MPDLERELYEVFDLGEQVQEPAEPAQANTSQEQPTGEQEQEPAEPAPTVSEPSGEQNTEVQCEPAEKPGEGREAKEELTPEQRRENAARRKQQEMQEHQAATERAVAEAIEKTKAEHAAEVEDLLKLLGLKNNKTGETVSTMEQLVEWKKQFEEERFQRELSQGKVTKEMLSAIVDEHPTVKRAQELLRADEQAKQAQRQAQAEAKIEEELVQIRSVDASIHTLEDLFKAPYGKELYDMTQRGYSLKDAHYLLTKDTLEAAKLEAAKQAGFNNARSKDHLQGTGTAQGAGAVSVPKEEMAMYRLFNPGASEAQIQEHYNKNMKK